MTLLHRLGYPSSTSPFRGCAPPFIHLSFLDSLPPSPLLLPRTERIFLSNLTLYPYAVSCAARAGDVLAKENVTQERLYLVLDGELEVSKGGIEIATVRPGEFAGEVSCKSR